MKNVLIYTDCYIFGGCENVIPILLKDIKLNSKFNISFSYRFSPEYQKGLSKKIKINEHSIYPIKLPGFNENRSLRSKITRRLISIFELVIIIYDIVVFIFHFKKINPEILFINNGGYPGARSCRSAAIAAKIVGVKQIYLNVNNIAEPYDSLKRILQYPIDRIIKFCVTKFITASKYAKKKLIESLNLKNDDVLWVLNTFQSDYVLTDRQKLRKDHHVDKNMFLIGCVGHLSLNKGHHHLLEAVRLLKEKYGCKSFKFILIGEGSENNNFANYIEEQGMNKCIEVIPFQWNIFEYYNAMDIYVHPSIAFDDLPFAVREAMSMGLPIIGSNFAGIPELVNNGQNGILVPPGNPLLLAEAIAYLIQNKKICQKFGDASKEIYEKELSPKSVIQAYHKLFNGELK
jgi:glycosyltransferase involved in cell wall biosynthesis